MAHLGTSPSSSWVETNLGGGLFQYALTLTNAVPLLASYVGLPAASLPVVSAPLFGNPGVYWNGNCAHDANGSFKTWGTNVLIDNSVFANLGAAAIIGAWYPLASGGGSTGPGFGNLIIRNSTFLNNGWTDQDTNWLGNTTFGLQSGGLTACAVDVHSISKTNFGPVGGYGQRAIQIYNNTISNCPGLAILVAGSGKVGILNNTINNANAVPFIANYNANFCGANSKGLDVLGSQNVCFQKVASSGSIMVANSADVDATSIPNTFTGTSLGLFLDTSVVQNRITGNLFR
jgi:hypothetical protein